MQGELRDGCLQKTVTLHRKSKNRDSFQGAAGVDNQRDLHYSGNFDNKGNKSGLES